MGVWMVAATMFGTKKMQVASKATQPVELNRILNDEVTDVNGGELHGSSILAALPKYGSAFAAFDPSATHAMLLYEYSVRHCGWLVGFGRKAVLLCWHVLTTDYAVKYHHKWPKCTDIKCETASLEDIERLCSAHQKCTGFTFSSQEESGIGCLKSCRPEVNTKASAAASV